ncbi:hypothetical protein [Microcoleus sp. FACHB-68]|uniref:hypothetical protein n=1 Tax=Microcoleus sp. FACHB-68 TaxID=2692826 RepID=UPI001686E879|nr:hypothetical protein [Microcoleus sp. FACHB-68]MBD1936250.1 hypothetical protein [Microcoleus sp. FACHB-68]
MPPITELTLAIQESESAEDSAGSIESSPPSLCAEESAVNTQDSAMQLSSQLTLPLHESESTENTADSVDKFDSINMEDATGSVDQFDSINIEETTGSAEQSNSLNCEDAGSAEQLNSPNCEDAGSAEQLNSPNCEDAGSAEQLNSPNSEDAGSADELNSPNCEDAGSADDSAISVVATSLAFHEANHAATPQISNLSVRLTLLGLGAGVAANAAALGFAGYNLFLAPPLDPGLETFAKATEQYQAGDIKQAVALAKSVASYSSAYHEANTAIEEWQQTWQVATRQVTMVEQAFKQSRWRDVLEEADKIPKIASWHKKIEPMVQQAAVKMDGEVQKLLKTASEQANAKDFTGALKSLKQIPKGWPDYAPVEAKIAEYTQKQRIKSEAVGHQLLQQAYNRAAAKDFAGAMAYLKKVPKGTTAYSTAQTKRAEYGKKLRIQTPPNSPKSNRQVQSARQPQKRAAISTEQLISSNDGVSAVSMRSIQSLNPGDFLQEINPMPGVWRG